MIHTYLINVYTELRNCSTVVQNELYGCVQSGFTPDETEVLKWEVHARHEILFGADRGNVSKYKPFSVLNVWFVFYLP